MGNYTVYDADGSALELDVPFDDGKSSKNNRRLAKFFDPEVTKMIFSKPETRARLAQFLENFIAGPERKQCVADMKFLDKCDEHTRAVDALSTGIVEMAASYTGAAAAYPLALPFGVASKVNRDTSHFSKMTVPFLNNLFQDARGCAEDRLAKYLYPEYVKFQLTQCARSSLSARPSLVGDFRSAYPGLGSAFCLASPSQPANPILFASDGFTSLHGRPVLNRGLLRDLPPGSAATLRLREALALGRETVELVVSFRRNDDSTKTPFWNLFFVCPLYLDGAIRYHLGAQINISANMGDHGKDVLRVLSFSPLGDDLRTTTAAAAPPTPRRRTFAGLFSRRERPPSPQPLIISAPLPTFPLLTPAPTIASTTTTEEPSSSSAARSTRTTAVLERPFDCSSTPYGSLVVLQRCVGGSVMRIVFCSALAHELIGGGGDDVVLGRDVFSVLVKDVAGEKKAVGELQAAVVKGMAAGETVVGEVVVGGAGKHKWHGSGNVGASFTALMFSGEGDKGARGSGSTERNAVLGGKMRKLVTHWTPLKDGEGKVEWVVLVLTPAAAR
ncbi:hypothetical protein B0T18DRAFT_425651 [Schizothecium vesticola]|uniref:PAS domain-containing protein n=1 Tax=Schizothecium vesticola TaxID=314040 RepID=A0AA40F461_9PEZI|nr:hypothetical protein B0T18DRAFT_425651 [Schizothecium vesticola]